VPETHRTASSLKLGKRENGRRIGRAKGGPDSKLHVMTNATGQAIQMIPAAGRISDCTGARTLVNHPPGGAKRFVAMRCDRCPEILLSACLPAATVMFWL